jgi:hypothetical protein
MRNVEGRDELDRGGAARVGLRQGAVGVHDKSAAPQDVLFEIVVEQCRHGSRSQQGNVSGRKIVADKDLGLPSGCFERFIDAGVAIAN